jgi:RNA polymerase sigma-70 factor, ECF subfamily
VEEVRQLIHLAQKNDYTAFEQLVLLYQGRVYSLAQKLTGSTLDAQDLAQEVFISAFRSLKSFRGDADFGTWLHRITVNIWLNSKRKTRIPTVSLDEQVKTDEGAINREVGTYETEPETVIMASELSELMQRALDMLPKEQKAVLVLRELEEHSYEEIAAIINCSLGTVRSRLSRAREALRRQVVSRADAEGVHIFSAQLAAGAPAGNEKEKKKEVKAGELHKG